MRAVDNWRILFLKPDVGKRGTGAMTSYNLYFMRNGQLLGGDKIEASDDREAGRIARDRAEGRSVEVWDAHRRVRIVAPN